MNDDPKMPEPAHPATYYCNKCGHYGPTGPAHANCNYNAVQYGPHYSAEQLLAYAEALAAARVAQERERCAKLVTTAEQTHEDATVAPAVGTLLDRRVRPLPPGDVWQPTPPDKPGAWWMLCGEVEGEPDLVRVEWRRGELWAVDCAIGSLPVQMYHDGLTACLWQEA